MTINNQRRWWALIVVANVLVLLFGFFLWWQANRTSYRHGDGQWSDANMWVPVLMVFASVAIIASVFLANAIIAIATSLPVVRRTCGVAAGAAVFVGACGWVLFQPAATPFMDGFVHWADREVDQNAIAQWLDATESDQQLEALASNRWPAAIAELDPTDVILLDNGQSVEIHFGGGFQRFGLSIVSDHDVGSPCAVRLRDCYTVPVNSTVCAWNQK